MAAAGFSRTVRRAPVTVAAVPSVSPRVPCAGMYGLCGQLTKCAAALGQVGRKL